MHNLENRILGYAKRFGQLLHAFSISVACSYKEHLRGGERGKVVFLSPACTTFLGHICAIISRFTQKKVRGSDTISSVALVVNTHSLWNWPIFKFPSNSVCPQGIPIIPIAGPDKSVAGGRISPTVPKPASIAFCFDNVGPKSLFKAFTLADARVGMATFGRAAFSFAASALEFGAAKGTIEARHSSFFTVFRRGASDILASLTSPTLTLLTP